MDLKTAKEKYKGLYIKDKGHSITDGTQLIFKSEVNKGGKLAYLIDNKIFILSDIVKTTLKSYLEDNNTKLPSGVEYSSERFKVPTSYLQLFASDATPSIKQEEELQIPTNTTDAELSVGTYTSGSYIIPILNKVAETAAKYRIMESQPFYQTMFFAMDYADQLNALMEKYQESKSDDDLVNLMLLCILYQKTQ